ncbi:MAG TPA: ABC transporter permease, partial [Candidatus Krumholzibacteria bacterium]|nr:ABC transporter permease [Candidatus Krumholzibacteria bacterium]
MIRFIARRLLTAVLLAFLVVSATFVVLHATPGDPTNLFENPRLSRAQQERIREIYGLDQSLPRQYLDWLEAVVLHADFGTSFSHREPVMTVLGEALPNTLILGLAALLIEFGLGVPIGVLAARWAGTLKDQVLRILSLLLYSLPIFWVGLMAILLFAYRWPLLPAGNMHGIAAIGANGWWRAFDLVRHLVLPASILGISAAGAIARFVRNSLLDTLAQPFIFAARARGLSEARIMWVHALRSALGPVAQLIGLSLPFLLSGALVIEVVFSWPGVGRLVYGAVLSRDYPLLMASTAIGGVMVVVGNLAADLIHAWLDPRV